MHASAPAPRSSLRLSLGLSLKMLARDARAGELRILLAALVIAVASVTSVGFFADRIGRALNQESHQLIGADFVVSSDRPLDGAVAAAAAARGLRVARAINFPSMAAHGGKTHLAGFKAVTPGYPLRGTLRIAPDRNLPDAPTKEIPAPGTVWLDEQLATSLQVKPGDKIAVGDSELVFAKVVTLEPDRGASFFSIAPRLLFNQADLAATQLIQPGSRVVYRLLAAGNELAVADYAVWVKANLARGQWIEEISNARPEVRASVDRAQQFLGLVALLAVILAAVSIALASRRFMQRHLDGCAVLRSMGASQHTLLTMFAAEFLLLGLIGSALGTVIGYAVHAVIAQILGYLVTTQLPAAGVLPARAQAAWNKAAFDAKTIDEVIKALGVAKPVESKDINFTAPDIAENGAVVPIAVSTTLPGVKRIAFLIEKNPTTLAGVFEFSDAVETSVSTRIKMAQTSNVLAVALMGDGKVLFAQKEVKVTLGGCGG